MISVGLMLMSGNVKTLEANTLACTIRICVYRNLGLVESTFRLEANAKKLNSTNQQK